MKKISAITKVVGGFLIFYLLHAAILFAIQSDRYFVKQQLLKAESVNDYAKISRILLERNDVVQLDSILRHAIVAERFDFSLLRRGDSTLFFHNPAGIAENIQVPLDGIEGYYEWRDYQYFIQKHSGYTLAIGFKSSLQNSDIGFWKDIKSLAINDFLVVVSMVAAMSVYFFRDLLRFIKRLATRGANRSDESIARSHETMTLIQGFKGLESSAVELESENVLMKNQVLPALRNELFSGKTPPYEFSCTMVRSDINGFTHVFSYGDRDEFMQTINDFFVDVAHIVSRYGGYIHEFVGDEVIFYFKDEDHSNSAAIAISAVRDMLARAEKIHQRSKTSPGYDFRLKTSVVAGTLRFGPLVNGYSLAGNPLIESVRMLAHVSDKSENVVVFDEDVRDRIQSICRAEAMGEFVLKGIKEPRKLFKYTEHVPVRSWLQDDRYNGSRELLGLYRSDSDIADLLRFVERHWREMPSDRSTQLLSHLKRFHLPEASGEIQQAYLSLLNDLLSDKEAQKKDYVLSTAVSVAAHLFQKKDLEGELKQALLKCLLDSNRRVVANAVDVFAELDPSSPEDIFAQLMKNNDNRILANTLTKQGKHAWDQRVRKRISGMLMSDNAFHRASGLYALGEIAHHMKTTDPVAFQADHRLQELIARALKLVHDPNPMIARQAARLSLKLQSKLQSKPNRARSAA